MQNKFKNIDDNNIKYFDSNIDLYNERDCDICIDIEIKNHTTAVALWLDFFANQLS